MTKPNSAAQFNIPPLPTDTDQAANELTTLIEEEKNLLNELKERADAETSPTTSKDSTAEEIANKQSVLAMKKKEAVKKAWDAKIPKEKLLELGYKENLIDEVYGGKEGEENTLDTSSAPGSTPDKDKGTLEQEQRTELLNNLMQMVAERNKSKKEDQKKLIELMELRKTLVQEENVATQTTENPADKKKGNPDNQQEEAVQIIEKLQATYNENKKKIKESNTDYSTLWEEYEKIKLWHVHLWPKFFQLDRKIGKLNKEEKILEKENQALEEQFEKAQRKLFPFAYFIADKITDPVMKKGFTEVVEMGKKKTRSYTSMKIWNGIKDDPRKLQSPLYQSEFIAPFLSKGRDNSTYYNLYGFSVRLINPQDVADTKGDFDQKNPKARYKVVDPSGKVLIDNINHDRALEIYMEKTQNYKNILEKEFTAAGGVVEDDTYELERKKRLAEEKEKGVNEIKEAVATDQEKKPLLYFAAEKVTNPVLQNEIRDSEADIVDLRHFDTVDGFAWEKKNLQRCGDNEGYFQYNLLGFVMIIKNVAEITNPDGIRAESEDAVYKIVGPDGQIIKDDIQGFKEAGEVYWSETGKYKEKVEAEFNSLSK